jgi:hypothetical protein
MGYDGRLLVGTGERFVGRAGADEMGAEMFEGVLSSSSHGSSSSLGAGVGVGRTSVEDVIGVAFPFDGVFNVVVSMGTAVLGAEVGVISDEQGVLLGYTGFRDGFTPPEVAVNAGALLGLNDSDAGS